MTNNMSTSSYINYNKPSPTSAPKQLNNVVFSNKNQNQVLIGFSNQKGLFGYAQN